MLIVYFHVCTGFLMLASSVRAILETLEVSLKEFSPRESLVNWDSGMKAGTQIIMFNEVRLRKS